jgi:hypothetical protein
MIMLHCLTLVAVYVWAHETMLAAAVQAIAAVEKNCL